MCVRKRKSPQREKDVTRAHLLIIIKIDSVGNYLNSSRSSGAKYVGCKKEVIYFKQRMFQLTTETKKKVTSTKR